MFTKETEKVLNFLNESIHYFQNTKYGPIIEEAKRLFWEGKDLSKTKKVLDSLPSDNVLLKELIQKLKGKSVYSNLIKSKGKEDFLTLKSLSSLLTHVLIECEQGNKEYRKLIPLLLEKINNLSYKLL